jgi:DnaJ-class molecular chaperone
MRLLLFLFTITAIWLTASGASDFFSSFGAGLNSRDGDPDDDGSYYKILGLGVNKRSTIDDIKKAYRKRAMELHPDKGGDAEQFKILGEAYEVLSDPQKKALYDRYGMAGLKGDGGQRSPAADFAQFFRGFSGFSVPIVFQLELSLEELFTGKDIDIPLERDVRVAVSVEPGMLNGQEMMARSKYSDPRGFARDIVVRIREVRHPVFQRKNADLMMEVKLTLRECLMGFEKKVRLLDGEELTVRSPAGEVVGAEAVFVLPDKGMPLFRRPSARGRLFVRTKLELPRGKLPLKGDELAELERLLSALEGGAAQKTAGSGSGSWMKSSRSVPHASASGADAAAATPAAAGDAEKLGRSKAQKLSTEDVTATAATVLKYGDIRSYGQYGVIDEDEEEDFIPSPFTQYFFGDTFFQCLSAFFGTATAVSSDG